MRPRGSEGYPERGKHEVGKCTRIMVFISTTRAAILMRREVTVIRDALHRTLWHRHA